MTSWAGIFASGLDPLLLEVGSVRLWWYGLAYAVGLLAVDLWVYARRERLDLGRRDVAEFSLLFAGGVLLGGRLFDVALYEWFYYGTHPWQIPRLWEGGMATHGVLLGAVVGTFVFCRWRKKSFLAIADEVVIPGAALLALGRIGNHINGEVYGTISDVGWAMRFPYAEGCRHPVALYDGAKNLLIVPVLLLAGRVRGRPRGLVLGCFLALYGLLRLFVDHYRDYDSFWLGVGRGQYFNVLVAVFGLAIVAAAWRYWGPPMKGREESTSRAAQDGSLAFVAARLAFFALVVLCLTIPSGWTQQVLASFESRVGAATTGQPAVTVCEVGSQPATTRRGRPCVSVARRRS